ncbi:carboxylating nicotinate-nucleotide diphosphorylase [soil metagenome]
MKYYSKIALKQCEALIKFALKEDIGTGDKTSELLISKSSTSQADILVKEDGVTAGIEIFKLVFRMLDKKIKIKFNIPEGSPVKKNTVIGNILGNTRNILKGERVALNILQRMSGIASQVHQLKTKLNNKNIKLLDTRKTTPNFRIFEKLAVKIGGGENHRTGLFDMILIKDNHIEAAGGIENVMQILEKSSKTRELKKEIEVKNLFEVMVVCSLGKGIIDRVMLDNFEMTDIKKAVSIINKMFEIELSGGINSGNISKYSKVKGIDYISIGALTHSVRSLDISLDFL